MKFVDVVRIILPLGVVGFVAKSLLSGAKARRPRPIRAAFRFVHDPPWTMSLESLGPEREWLTGRQTSDVVVGWLTKRGAIDTNRSFVRVAVTSNVDRSVLITDMRAHVRQRQPFYGSTSVTHGTAGAGGAILIGIDLDVHDPHALALKAGPSQFAFEPDGRYFEAGRNLTVNPGEQLDLLVAVKAEHGFYEWDLMATFNVAGRPTHREIRLNDEPFRITGLPAAGHATAFEWAWFLPESRLIPDGTGAEYF